MSQSHDHDHHHCIHTAIDRARSLCSERGLRLTPIRQRVLELIWQNHQPIGAYDLLPQLAEDGFNSAPPTVYRALDFLLELGVVHRISSLNAFIGCDHPGHQHPTGFFVCQGCGNATELPIDAITALSDSLTASLDADIATCNIELSGTCRDCRN